MGILKTFLGFAESLNEEDRADAEQMLLKYMQDYNARFPLTAKQEAEVARRLADPNPKYATDAEIEAILGRSFNK